MKQGIKILVGALVLGSTLIACAKKGGGSAAATAAVNPYNVNACVVTSANSCSGLVPIGTWKGNVTVSNMANYQLFLAESGMCAQIQTAQVPNFRYDPRYRQIRCDFASQYFSLQLQTVTEEIPGPVNFDIDARFGGYGKISYARSQSGNRYNMTQADAIMNQGGNGFRVVFNRLMQGFGGQQGYYGQRYDQFGRPIVVPYGTNVLPTNVQQQNLNSQLVITATYVDVLRSALNVTVSYKGLPIGQGVIRGGGAAPEVLPANGVPGYSRPY